VSTLTFVLVYSDTRPLRKQKQGPLPVFLADFLALGRVMPVFLRKFPFFTPPPSRRPAVRRAMDPRGTIAKRRKYGRFLPHQRANVDQVPEREQLRPRE
jgi:hypothetical protein